MEPKFQLRRGGYAIRKSHITEKEKKQIMKDLYVVPRVKGSVSMIPPQPFPIYLESATRFYLPQHYGKSTFGPPQSDVLPRGIKCDSLEFAGSLRDKQKPVVDIFKQSKGGGVLSVPCGFGKTCCAIYLACWLKRKTLVVVHKNFLLSQWIERIRQFAPTARIGRIQGKVIDVENKDIVIGMLQSLSMKEYEPKVFKQFGFTVVDECFPYQQHIITEKGSIKIGKIYDMWKNNQELPKVKSFNLVTKTFEYKDITYAWEKSYKDRMIHIKCGRNIYKSTPNHKYLSKNGWKQASELLTGDVLITNIDYNINKNFYRILNPDQIQIILGSFLGDGHIQVFKHNKFRLKITHSIKQKDYCQWKSNMFEQDIHYNKKGGYSNTQTVSFATEVFYFDNKFPSKKQTVPKWMIDKIDLRGIAIWFMDDGSINPSSYSITLHTQSFDQTSQDLFIQKFKQYDIEAKYHISKKNDTQYYYIRFNKDNSIKLVKLIQPYLHESMKYKIQTQKLIELQENYNGNSHKYYNPYNIPKEILKINNYYDIYRRNGTSYKCKYIHCAKCGKNVFTTSDRGYYYCKHKKHLDKKQISTNQLISIINLNQTSRYVWNKIFTNYGYIVIDSISSSKYTLSNVYDIEVADNHNSILCGKNSKYGPVVHNCHHISAEVFSRALPMLGSRWNLGLSATPDRTDGLSKVFYWHLGPLLYPTKDDIVVRPEKGDQEISSQCIVKKIEYTHTDPSYSQEPETAQGKPNTARMITQVCEWHRRNILIMQILKLCIIKKRVILLLSDRRSMLNNLEIMIQRKFPKTSVGQYVGGMKQRLLDESAKCDIILSTYAMSSEGMDIPRINTVVLASPKSNVEQSVGRAQRKLHAEGVWLFDIVDMFSLFPRQWERRKAFYRKYVSTGSYKKMRYPIEVYRVKDEHNKPVELLADAISKPLSVTKTTDKDTPSKPRVSKDKVVLKACAFVEES